MKFSIVLSSYCKILFQAWHQSWWSNWKNDGKGNMVYLENMHDYQNSKGLWNILHSAVSAHTQKKITLLDKCQLMVSCHFATQTCTLCNVQRCPCQTLAIQTYFCQLLAPYLVFKGLPDDRVNIIDLAHLLWSRESGSLADHGQNTAAAAAVPQAKLIFQVHYISTGREGVPANCFATL